MIKNSIWSSAANLEKLSLISACGFFWDLFLFFCFGPWSVPWHWSSSKHFSSTSSSFLAQYSLCSSRNDLSSKTKKQTQHSLKQQQQQMRQATNQVPGTDTLKMDVPVLSSRLTLSCLDPWSRINTPPSRISAMNYKMYKYKYGIGCTIAFFI